ncbi:MAG: hypothetical protein IJ794_19280 [Lachnospiraceae bacterium]|nr:hypothetical protein [Lachnospiraceae bacterium]
MKLYIIFFSTVHGDAPQIYSYTGKADGQVASNPGEGLDIVRNTTNCWYIGDIPKGLPERYRKSEEYKLLNNSSGIYMYGREAGLLIDEWNRAVKV